MFIMYVCMYVCIFMHMLHTDIFLLKAQSFDVIILLNRSRMTLFKIFPVSPCYG